MNMDQNHQHELSSNPEALVSETYLKTGQMEEEIMKEEKGIVENGENLVKTKSAIMFETQEERNQRIKRSKDKLVEMVLKSKDIYYHIDLSIRNFSRQMQDWKWYWKLLKKGIDVLSIENLNQKIAYQGEWDNGNMNGYGICYKINDGQKEVVYEGEFLCGKFQGKGILYESDGAKYEGEFRNGMKNGKGFCYYQNKDIYKGQWKEGKIHGKGVYFWSNGEKYEGQFRDGEKNGMGKFYGAGANIKQTLSEIGRMKI